VARRRFVVNASPVIFLTQIGSLSLLNKFADEVAVPASVRDEVLAGAARHDGFTPIQLPEWLVVLPDLPVPVEVAAWDLGAGESQVLTHVSGQEDEAVLDDLQARRCARALGILTTGTLGIVLRAKRARLVPAARPLIEELLRKGLYLAKDLVDTALIDVGE
jgi:predicted nucleic acid-binding protein